MKIGIFTDHGQVAHWQAEALREISEDNHFIVFDCVNSYSTRRFFANALYYLLNLFTVRNRQTTSVPIPSGIKILDRFEFAAEADGAWQRLPDMLLARIADDHPAVILKFGMGLVRVPSRDRLACPILSYHHGDPRQFRGRPAGFYELRAGKPVLGQIVQVLSNRLDAGRIVNFAESKVHPHSYRKTLVDAYRCSPLILRRAIENAIENRDLQLERNGKNYRLPSNLMVLGFLSKLFKAKLQRLVYGAFFEKAWQVAEAPVLDSWSPQKVDGLCEEQEWQTLVPPSNYGFLADPFYEPTGDGFLAEAMRLDGRGEIVRLKGAHVQPLKIDGGHCSYPAPIVLEGRSFIVPETSGWSGPRLFELSAGGVDDLGELRIDGAPRLLDPTLHAHEGALFLFGNLLGEGDGILRLWVADSLFDDFAEHPYSPIRISPAGARMGGPILAHAGGLYRVGQDFRRGYGDGIILFRIDELTRHVYRESEAGCLRFGAHRGPHTLSIRGTRALFDYYEERFSLFAGVRRVRQRRAGRGPRQPTTNA